MNSMNGLLMLDNIKPCPFCGNQPSVTSEGSCIDIECCASMSIQKSDYLDMDERETWNYTTLQFSDEVEEKAMKVIVDMWNRRTNGE